MPDPIIDDPTTVLDGQWYDTMVPESDDNSARREMLSGYETQDAFFDAHHEAVNADWRKGIAGDDDKFLSKLSRFTEASDFGNAYREAEQKIRAGNLGPTAPGAEATDEEISAYRTEIGVPLEAAGYLEDLPDGLVVGENDKELMEDFMGAIHEIHASTPFAHKAIEWYNGLDERMQDARMDRDTEQSKEATDELRDAWGKDYRTNMNLITGLLKSTFGDEASDMLVNGRFKDETGFFNNVGVMKGFAELARKVNPIAPLIPNDQKAVASLHEEIALYEGKMGTMEYKKDEKMQARLRELYDIRSNLDEADAA
jgi:hypothetical protein